MLSRIDQKGARLLSDILRSGNRGIRAPKHYRAGIRGASISSRCARLNNRLRKTLGFATPDEVFSGLVDKAANVVTSRNAEGVRYGT